MDFKETSNVFGGTVFSEEYRGDFEEIKRDIEHRERSAQFRDSPNTKAEILLLKGVFEALRGEYAACQANLDKIKVFESEIDDRWRARCRIYERFNLISMLVPPVIRFRSNLSGSASTIREAELEAAQKFLIQLPIPRDATPFDLFENTLASSLMTFNIAFWTSASFHPQFAHAGLKAATASHVAMLRDIPPADMINMASLLGLDKVAAYLLRLKCDIEASRTNPTPPTAFQSLRDAYLGPRDAVGMAIYHIIIGDRFISPPFTSPIAFNLIVDGVLTGWLNEEWDRAEPSFRLTDDQRAREHYSLALSMVQNVTAPRVKAAVFLRRACVQHMAGIRANSSGRAEEAKMLFDDALRNLITARLGFSLDESNLHIIDCHKLLLDISCRRYAKVEEDAAAIGSWGRSSGNTVLAQFLGILIMRFGRRYYLDYSRVDLALLCCKCARACFQTLDDELFKLQARLAEAQLKHLSGNFVAAQVIIDEERKDMKALEHVRNLAKASPSNAHALSLPMVNLLTAFNRIASTVYSSANDASALQVWLKEYRELKDDMDLKKIFGPPGSWTTAVNFTSESSGQALDAVALIEETDNAQKLQERYIDFLNEGYAALDQANVDGEDGFEACMRKFLAESETFNAPEDIRLVFQIIAHTLLGDLATAREILPRAIATTFGGSATNLVTSELRRVRIDDVPISSEFEIDSNAAERAISLCFLSRDWRRAATLVHEIVHALPEYLCLDRLPTEGSNWKLATWVACIYEHDGQLDKALSWYLWARRAMETQRSHTEDPDARRGMQWSIHTAELFAGLTRIALQLHKSCDDGYRAKRPALWGLLASTWLEQALIFTEESFARTLLEIMIAHDTTKLEVLQVWAAKSFLHRQIDDIKSLQAVPEDRIRDKKLVASFKQEREQLEKELRELERQLEAESTSSENLSTASESMLSATRFKIDTKSIFDAIPPDALVVEINTSRGGLIVLGITNEGIQVTHQASISDIELRKLIFPYIKARREGVHDVLDKKLLNELQKISETIVNPIKDLLKGKDHVIFVPSSIFMAFPFCCLLFNQRSLVLQKAVSQVPSLAILQRLVQRSRKKTKAKGLSAIVNSHDQGGSPVPMVGVGSFCISRLFETVPVTADDLDEQSFAEKYEKSVIVHVATHGVQSAISPWQSYISLKERFRVMELAKLTSEAALVVFGACLSGLGRSTNGNDLLGFSHAVLQSGAQVYIGALWEVSDWATMLLMLLFYRKLAEREPRLSIAKAWQHAQKSFYNLTTETAVSFLEEIAGAWDVAEKEGLNPRQFSKLGKGQLKFLMQDLEDDPVDFTDPYFWAPFVLVGNADLCISELAL